MNTIIETNRLILRTFKATDWQDFYEYFSDEKILKFEPFKPFTEEECKEEVIHRSTNSDFIAVCLKDTGKLIGNLYFAKGDFMTWEVGYVFNSKFYGQGYATESVKAIMDYAFSTLGARRIIAMCDPKNTPSWKLLERIHMRREGHLIQNIYFFEDEDNKPIWKDTYQYAILATEWKF